jgi:hypothetical protein
VCSYSLSGTNTFSLRTNQPLASSTFLHNKSAPATNHMNTGVALMDGHLFFSLFLGQTLLPMVMLLMGFKILQDKRKTNYTYENLSTMHERRTNVPSIVLNIIQHTVC